ncbi:MAG: NnrS family protein [Helicobacteraceae bacterium]|nr:NnrS family protein [Candidatus Sulfurimonas ponti]MBL6972891.1 NnrS family protein [Sulfurimonas sp.]
MTQEISEENYFLSQPHQPFFILAIVNAIVMILVFALSFKGVLSLEISSLNFHAYTIIFTVFLNVFTGFLFTTFSRFTQHQVIEKDTYLKIFFANLLGTVLFLAGAFTNEIVLHLGILILFSSNIYIVYILDKIYKNGLAADKQDAYWILVANYFGVFAHFLFLLSSFVPGLENIAIKISFYLYLIFLTFAVAQRMIPFFSHSFEPKAERLLVVIFTLFVLRTLFSVLDIGVAEIILDLLLGFFLLREFLRWKLSPLNSPAILWVLHLGLSWLPIAFLLSALSLTVELLLDTDFYYLNIHLLAIGFVTTILIGFGTRVTLGHSSQAPHADKFAISLFWFIQIIVLLRALYSVNIAFAWNLNFLFDISFTAWLLLFALWGGRYFKVLVLGKKL